MCLMGEGSIGGMSIPLRIYLISDFVFQDTKIFFASVINIISGVWFNFHFQMSRGWFPWLPTGGCTIPINTEVFFSDILAPATRLNTLYGLETLI